MRFASTLWTSLSWISQQASPASTSSLLTVLIDTSHTRLIERMDEPSHSMERIWTRLARGSLFILIGYEFLCLVSSIYQRTVVLTPYGKLTKVSSCLYI